MGACLGNESATTDGLVWHMLRQANKDLLNGTADSQAVAFAATIPRPQEPEEEMIFGLTALSFHEGVQKLFRQLKERQARKVLKVQNELMGLEAPSKEPPPK